MGSSEAMVAGSSKVRSKVSSKANSKVVAVGEAW